jgi:glycosyltransferase involved in cell wall biosynthesis
MERQNSNGGRPLVSVIIPAYNAGPYVAETIDSALAQTYKNIEIIVVEKDSADNTHEVLEPYIKKKLITYIHQDGKGLSNARNIAIKHSRGEFIALLDADDFFLPQKIEKQVAYLLQHPECDVCYCDFLQFYHGAPEKTLRLNYTYYSGADTFPHLLRKNFIAPVNVVLRRSTIDRVGGFNETYYRTEDWEYWVRLAYRGAMFCFLPETLVKVRIHPESMSQVWSGQTEDKKMVMRIFTTLAAEMSPEERRRYHMGWVLFRHRLNLWYIYFANHFPPLQWLYKWLQRNRRK